MEWNLNGTVIGYITVWIYVIFKKDFCGDPVQTPKITLFPRLSTIFLGRGSLCKNHTSTAHLIYLHRVWTNGTESSKLWNNAVLRMCNREAQTVNVLRHPKKHNLQSPQGLSNNCKHINGGALKCGFPPHYPTLNNKHKGIIGKTKPLKIWRFLQYIIVE